MDLGGYRLIAQLGAGKDGVAYRAETPDGTPVELHQLGGARADPLRWSALDRRLRLAILHDHPGARKVILFAARDAPPWVVLERLDAEPLDRALHLPLPLDQALARARSLAEVLSAAHRVGLVHGQVAPGSVYLNRFGVLKLDFTGLRTGTAEQPAGESTTDPAEDEKGFGAVLCWLLTGRLPAADFKPPDNLPGSAKKLLADLLTADPQERSSVRAALEQLRRFTDSMTSTGEFAESIVNSMSATHVPDPAHPTESLPHERLGRYRLIQRLGQGGMGTVYRAEDTLDGRIVALKVLRSELAADPLKVKRFHKEARMLAEINNPHVTNLLDVNEDDGFHYLALEFASGPSLERILEERGRLPERDALEIMADVARGLVDAHGHGVIHRDIKPGNILLSFSRERSASAETSALAERSRLNDVVAKLSDFGLARHIVETASLQVTRAGAVIGTPMYMSPEQCSGGTVDARSDIYSMGATLYHVLSGRTPFQADNMLELFAMHARQMPPPLRALNPELSEGVCRVVEKALAKAPADRYPDADALLRELERLLRGEPADLTVHPRRPDHDPRRVVRYEFTWDLEASPAQLWSHVSNTERLNRAAGLSAPRYTVQSPAAGEAPPAPSDVPIQPRPRRFAELRVAGFPIAWEEQPFEWVEGRRFGVLREFSRGPFRWYTSTVELEPRGFGTKLRHVIEVEPRGLLGRTLAAIEIGFRARRRLGRVYRRIDATLLGSITTPSGLTPPDPFEATAKLGRARRQRLDRIADDLQRRGVSAEIARRLVEYVAEAAPQDVARIRPIALARTLGLDPDTIVTACLHGVRAGLFLLLWDVLCPSCRIPTAVKDTLRMLREHEHCEACNLNFDLDFANSVELIFRAHPEVRDCELGTFCVGGPAHSPHVVAQARIAKGERLVLDLALTDGAYRLRGAQLPYAIDLRVRPHGTTSRLDLNLSRPAGPSEPIVLRPGGQVFALNHDYSGEILVRIERATQRDDALTAARASSLDLFRELFPDEVLSPGRLVTVATTTLMMTALDGAADLYRRLGDARAFAVVHEHFTRLRERIRAEGGALVKTIGEGVVAAFPDAASAVRVALDISAVLAASELTRGLRLRVGVHRGPMLTATVNDQLDYFGTSVRQALALPALAAAGEVILTQPVSSDPAVAAMIARRGGSELFIAELAGVTGNVLLRLRQVA